MQLEEMQAVVIEVVKPFYGETVEFDGDTPLLDDGNIDSMIMVMIILDLERRLGREIGVTAVAFDDFASVRTLAQQLCRITGNL
jgi:acyl carrier protein